jgi:LmbE family N-acetylglucosaminyl deacetylase
MDPIGGRDREGRVVQPDFVVDVSATFERKRQMLAEHMSQREWLQHHHGVDEYVLEMERWTRERGTLAGVSYGEGFRQYRGHPYPQTPILQDALRKTVTCIL